MTKWVILIQVNDHKNWKQLNKVPIQWSGNSIALQKITKSRNPSFFGTVSANCGSFHWTHSIQLLNFVPVCSIQRWLTVHKDAEITSKHVSHFLHPIYSLAVAFLKLLRLLDLNQAECSAAESWGNSVSGDSAQVCSHSADWTLL